MRLRDDVEPKWVMYAMQRPAVRHWADEHRHGVGRPRLGLKVIRQIPVPLPLLEDQRRIVSILDDHLSRLEAASRLIETCIKRRDALIAAYTLRLLEGAGGELMPLGQMSLSIKNGIFISRPGVEPNGVPILRIGAVRPLALSTDDLRYSGRSAQDLTAADALLSADDLLFTRYNGNPRFVGACAVVEEAALPLTYPDKLIRVRVDAQRALTEFVALSCSYGSGRRQIEQRIKTSAGQAGISGRELKSVQLHLPSLEDQARVVNAVNALLGAVVPLERQIRSLRSRTAGLRRAVLAAAFEGKLAGRQTDGEAIEAMADDQR